MGQRSQIYIRIKDKNDNKTLIANYYQWNYGERMISRARYGIEYIKRNIDFSFDRELIEKISRNFDINYDMKDVQLSVNILDELKEYYFYDKDDINRFIFLEQGNNDGKLFVDFDQKTNKIKYCFTDRELKPLSADEYMNWNIGMKWEEKEFSSDKDWDKIAKICKKNIKAINKDAELMSDVELNKFINDDYTKQIDIKQDVKI